MHQSDHSNDNPSQPASEEERVSVGDDIQESLGFYDDLLGHEDARAETWSAADDPEADLFKDSGNEKSLSEQAKKDYSLLRSGSVDGARAYMRDFVPPIMMWSLLAGALIVGSETAIDAVGPSAGPLWDLRVAVINSMWMPLVDVAGIAANLAENNLLVVGLFATLALAIFHKRRW